MYRDHLDEVRVLPMVQRRMAEEAFHVLFANRALLFTFRQIFLPYCVRQELKRS